MPRIDNQCTYQIILLNNSYTDSSLVCRIQLGPYQRLFRQVRRWMKRYQSKWLAARGFYKDEPGASGLDLIEASGFSLKRMSVSMFSNFKLAGPISRGSSNSFAGCDTMGPAHIALVVRRLLSMKAPKVT